MIAPKILGLTMVKNEQDLIEAFVRHNIRLLDRLVVLDNGSVDDTRSILARLSQELGSLVVVDDEQFGYTQSERMTRLLHQYQPVFAANYIVLLDADEFLDASDRTTFQAVLEPIAPGGYGLVPWCTFVLTPNSADSALNDPPRSIVWRRRQEEPPFRKAILRLDGGSPQDLVIGQGNHNVRSIAGRQIPSVELSGLRLLHYPVRSRDQLIAKSVVGWMAYLAKDARAAELGQGGQWQANFERIADGQAIGLQELCEASALYAQTATKVDWTRDVIQETPRFDYERRYSSGRFLGSTELIVRSWKQSVIAAQRPVSSHSQMIIEPQTKQHQTNLNGAVHNRSHMRAQEAGKQMSTAEETVAQLVQNGRLEEAERLTAASLAQGETVELWNDWATIQCRRNRIAEAEQGYRRALVLDGSARQPAVNLAVLLLAQGRLEESIPVLRSVAGKLTQPEKEALRQLVIRRQPATQAAQASDAEGRCGLVLSVPILQRMRPIQGWLEEQEADLLMAGVVRALNTLPNGAAVVEVGSYCGRSTVVLGSVVKAFGAKTRVYAIDPHQGVVGAADQGLQTLAPTLATFRHNLTINGLCEVVETIQKCSFEVTWSKPIGFLFIDGLHDYANVARDFRHFEPWLLPGAYIAFHDYADHYPGVKAFVNELLATTQYQRIHSQASLIIVRRDPAFARAEYGRPGVEAVSHRFTYGSASPML